MQKQYKTTRLLLDELSLNDIDFIFELVNTADWITFIGDRNIKTQQDAIAYVQKIIDNNGVKYWVVKLQEQKLPIGVVTFIKRDYLDYHDIGFAFLPLHTKHGYAYEASLAVLNEIINEENHFNVLATTIKENKPSIQLLEKLGFEYHKTIINENTELFLYGVTADKVQIDCLTSTFFNVFKTTKQIESGWSEIYDICIPETIIIKKMEETEVVYNLNSFIEPRKKILSDGTLTDFEEKEIQSETKIIHHIAQRFSRYQKSGYLNGKYFKEYGSKFFQFIKTTSGWKINSLIWEDDKI